MTNWPTRAMYANSGSVASKINLFGRISKLTAEHYQLMSDPRDILRRHTLLHEASHTPIVVSCNACRANKTKCSGGTPCLLCARRGINCIFGSRLRRPKGASATNGSTAVNVSVDEDDDNDETALPTNPTPEIFQAENLLSAEGELLPSNVEFLQKLTIVPSKQVPTSKFHPMHSGIGSIHDLLVAGKSSLQGAIQDSDELKELVTKHVRTYFTKFHLRWPFLHAPTFDIRTVTLPLAASVCVVGTWLQGGAQFTERAFALRVHEVLLQRLLQDLVRIIYLSPRDDKLISYRLTQN